MGKIILYGSKLSPPVRAVLLVAEAINIDIEFKYIDFKSQEHLSEEFVKLNPQHTVPTIDDNGKILWESHAIVAYLVDKYAKNDDLYSKDVYQRALINQRLFFDAEILYTRLRNISMGIYFTSEKTIPQKRIDEVHEGYSFLEKFLEKNEYVIGDKLTIADLCCIATVSSCQGFAPITNDNYPKIYKWMQKMYKLPYYEKANGYDAKIYIEFLKDLLKEKQ